MEPAEGVILFMAGASLGFVMGLFLALLVRTRKKRQRND